MNHPDHDPEEADLRALFDGTADELGGPGLTKLRARAADIPAQRRPIWWRVLAPGFALALGAIVVFGVRAMNRPEAPTLAVTRPLPTVVAAPTPSATSPAEELEEEEEDDDSDPLALNDDDDSDEIYFADGSEDLLAFGVPSSDAELDAWLEATDDLLGEGG